MKKFWEKHDLFKIAGIMVIITVLLTWIIPQGTWSGTELTVGDITRVGIFDFFTYGLLGVYYFTVLVTFLFVLGGFYQVLAKTGGYQKLTQSIAKKFSRKETLFVLIVSFIIAAITAVTNEYFVIIALIPFIITIMSKMKLDKLTGFAATFGAILIGIIGSVYSTKVVGMNVNNLAVGYDTYLWVKLTLFGIAYAAFSIFNIVHIGKTLKSKKNEEIIDIFEVEETTKKSKVWPVALIFGLFALIAILAYLPWEEVFKVSIFADATKWVNEVEILDATIFQYLLGNVTSFGTWDVFGVQVLMLITSILIKWIYKLDANEFYSAFGEGFKKTGKLVMMLLISYIILEFAVMYPVIPTIVDWIMSITDKFNVILSVVSGTVASLFTSEYQYTVSLVGSYFTGAYAGLAKELPIMLQATHGLAMLFTPASAILLIGLTYLDISYKAWFKFIWKFLLIMFIAIVVLMLVIC